MDDLFREVWHFEEPYTSREEVEEALGPFYDGSTLSKVADCPRKYELSKEERITRGANRKMLAGSAIHWGLDYYYAHPNPTKETEVKAIEATISKWRDMGAEDSPPGDKEDHLTEGHLRTVLNYYFDTWVRQRIQVHEPLNVFTLDDLDLSGVVAAKFRLTPDDHVILGESSIVMRFDVDGEDLLLAGKPDLPVRNQAGYVYVMDHKTTGSYLSDWWASKFETSNKLRGYMAMISSLLGGERITGALVNAVYVGKRASSPDFGGTRFNRYEFDFTPDHVDEALVNQLTWIKTIDFYRSEGYFPQGCGFGGCSYPDICRRDPRTRDVVKAREYQHDDIDFFDIP